MQKKGKAQARQHNCKQSRHAQSPVTSPGCQAMGYARHKADDYRKTDRQTERQISQTDQTHRSDRQIRHASARRHPEANTTSPVTVWTPAEPHTVATPFNYVGSKIRHRKAQAVSRKPRSTAMISG